MRKLIVVGTSVLAVLVAAGPALAHVTVQPAEGVIGSFSAFVVRVPNERDNASTIKVEVQFPPLEFPAIQTYDNEVVRWIGPPDSEEPAALVETVDLGAEEGEGELSVLSELSGGASGEEPVEGEDAEGGAAASASDDEESSLPLILGWIGVGLGAVALVVALTRRRA